MLLEKMNDVSIETNVLKGFGTASEAVGKFIGSIPVVKGGSVDEFFQDRGSHIKAGAKDIEQSIIKNFAVISNPETYIFIEKMEELIQLYNHTEKIYFDDKEIYLIAGEKIQ